MTNEELLRAVTDVVDDRFQNFEKSVDDRFQNFEESVDNRFHDFEEKMDKKLRETENNILEEVDTVQEKSNHHFKQVEKRLEHIETEVCSLRLQNDTLNLMSRRIDKMQDEIDELRQKVS